MKALSIFSFGLYSLIGAFALMSAYLTLYGVNRLELRMQGKSPVRERVLLFIVVSVLVGMLVGSLAQGLAEVRDECAASGQNPKPCLWKRLGR
jgi:hypothetical protein